MAIEVDASFEDLSGQANCVGAGARAKRIVEQITEGIADQIFNWSSDWSIGTIGFSERR